MSLILLFQPLAAAADGEPRAEGCRAFGPGDGLGLVYEGTAYYRPAEGGSFTLLGNLPGNVRFGFTGRSYCFRIGEIQTSRFQHPPLEADLKQPPEQPGATWSQAEQGEEATFTQLTDSAGTIIWVRTTVRPVSMPPDLAAACQPLGVRPGLGLVASGARTYTRSFVDQKVKRDYYIFTPASSAEQRCYEIGDTYKGSFITEDDGSYVGAHDLKSDVIGRERSFTAITRDGHTTWVLSDNVNRAAAYPPGRDPADGITVGESLGNLNGIGNLNLGLPLAP
ncbi:hypothetical protein ACIBG8_04475 [Nonomuraea sp. NPDC050556]|uniref:hypothetical protein n=1 Tax=Nonomuraea sp. NPDC050556 TaxID=3364369 RepID=UPI00379C0B9A